MNFTLIICMAAFFLIGILGSVFFNNALAKFRSRSRSEKNKKPETSKAALASVLIFYFIFVIYGMVYVFARNNGFEALCGLVGIPTAAAISWYEWKAKGENVEKIRLLSAENKNDDGQEEERGEENHENQLEEEADIP